MAEEKDVTQKQTAEQEKHAAADETQDMTQETAGKTETGRDKRSEAEATGDISDNKDKPDADGSRDSIEDGGKSGNSNAEHDTNSETKEAAGKAQAEDADSTESKGSADNEDDENDSKPDKKDKQIEELSDRYKRLFAEFDNFRKRTEAEKTVMFAEGERTVLLKVLPLIDNFERALDSIPEEQKGTALAEGIDKTYKAFMAQLKELGVTPIEACGKTFDANLHNAVMHVEDENIDENTVTEELQKGYMFKDKVLRYSMVKVAN